MRKLETSLTVKLDNSLPLRYQVVYLPIDEDDFWRVLLVKALEAVAGGGGVRACLIIRFRAHSGSTQRRTHDCLALQEKKLGKNLFNNCRL